jgi:osmotically-inducible protein OsmY
MDRARGEAMTQRAWLGLALALGALAGCHRDDATLTAQVQSKVNTTVKTPSADILVQVDDGVVTLSGIVPSAGLKTKAEQAAGHVEGVKAVKDDLKVGAPAGATIPDGTPKSGP